MHVGVCSVFGVLRVLQAVPCWGGLSVCSEYGVKFMLSLLQYGLWVSK